MPSLFKTSSLVGAISLVLACQPTAESDIAQPSAQATIASANDAHWISADLLLSDAPETATGFLMTTQLQDGTLVKSPLEQVDVPNDIKAEFPHLGDYKGYRLTPAQKAQTLLKGYNQLVYLTTDKTKHVADIQLYGALDDIYTSGKNDANEVVDFGAKLTSNGVQFKLWAPTATSVKVTLFDANKQRLEVGSQAMLEDGKSGVWQLNLEGKFDGIYYQYDIDVFHSATNQFEQLTVTDPYSLSLSTNSKYSQIVDLSSPSTMPKGWQNHAVPTVSAPEDLILYETHIRDFSASDSALSDPAFKGKYKAFSEKGSYGMKHLTMLRDAGLNTVHLLPTYDLSTINEDPNQAIDIDDPMSKVCDLVDNLSICQSVAPEQTLRATLSSFDVRSGEAQALMEQIRNADNYNWGYDPYHYTVPEGSYAVNPEGKARIIEFREMVQSLHQMGFRVIMDVVYNHTFASGIHDKSVLDKVVPGYYHRLNPQTGAIEQSTCCDNSATEHAMMEKLMNDSLIVWAKEYKIDGFRFDLMGHQPKDAMLRAREAVEAVDPDTYFYGEGWNFGEVANNAQFVQASQQELAGTQIGTFTDRLRDAVRGGNFMTNAEGLRRDQGIGNGLYVVPNELQPQDAQRTHYYGSMDVVRLGLAANLKHFSMASIEGKTITGTDVLYGNSPAGYALDPADTINYVSKHDNQTLWDNHQYRMPYDMDVDTRVRAHMLSLAYPMLAQGIPFIHMGSELLRSKSFLRDSYDYGDWFNAVDFSYQSNNYDVGLPPAEKDKDNWPVISKLLKENGDNDDVTPAHIEYSAKAFADLIRLRQSTQLFRLTTAQQVTEKVSFLNTGKEHQPGLIVMQIDDSKGAAIDQNISKVLVVFNNNATEQTFTLSGADEFALHPVQQQGVDEVVKQVKLTKSGLTVQPYTATVLIKN